MTFFLIIVAAIAFFLIGRYTSPTFKNYQIYKMMAVKRTINERDYLFMKHIALRNATTEEVGQIMQIENGVEGG